MDNVKTGALIRRLRKEKNMTQKDLAGILHITEQAVSKWERGLCAPDLAVMEALAQTLGLSVLELIQGERVENRENGPDREEDVRKVIDYSQREIIQKIGAARRKYILLLITALVIAVMTLLFFFWRNGWLFVLDRCPSPDGSSLVTVYSKELTGNGFGVNDAVSILIDQGKEKGIVRVTYGACEYQGLWWAPDSRKYVLALQYEDGIRLSLADLNRNSETSLSTVLTFGMEATELKKYGYAVTDGWPEIEYQFLQWGKDSAAMLIYYYFEDGEGVLHEGYFWYNYENGSIKAILEMGD